MLYVSTRGEAPPLGFIDVTLAGLARDGGLYVPQSWPQLSSDTIASFAGRDYAEVAVEVIRPFTGDQISVSDLSHPTEFDAISFDLRKGEILGFYGLVGAGRSEFCQALFGITRPSAGTIELEGQRIDIRSPAHAMAVSRKSS